MRTEEHWEKYVLPKMMLKFSPRLRRDLETLKIKTPKEDPEKPGSFYLWGDTGTGKTTTAAKMFLETQHRMFMERLPGSCTWITTYDFLKDLKSSFDNPTLDEFALMARYATMAHLFLDDLGDQKLTDWALSQLQVLINQRYELLLPIVITSNLSLDELGKATGDVRLPSRIKRMCKIIEMNG